MKFYFSKFDRNYKPNDQEAQQTTNTKKKIGENYTKAHNSQINLKWYEKKILKTTRKKETCYEEQQR